jgi:hypothetical protein
MASGGQTAGTLVRTGAVRQIAVPRWAPQAWGAIGITGLFIGITCWWLTQDHSIPVYDAGRHLWFAFDVFEALRAGRIAHALTWTQPYPPLAYLVGDLGILLGGIDIAPPIIAENLVFVPLLALGCYHVGRLAFGRDAGLMAVVFALGSPLITAQFHVFMLDAPETAMVAVSLWAILASQGFSRVGVSALAGLSVGVGLLIKEPLILFVAGPLAVTAARGGWRAWRGLAAFALVLLATAAPWYVTELARVSSLGSAALGEAVSPPGSPGIAPPRFSAENLEWYFWNMINEQLYLPLFAFAAVGWIWMILGFVRRRPVSRFAPELAIGAAVAWLAITETFVRDTRYSMPLLVYLAVFGVGWIARLPRGARTASQIVLTLAAAANVAAVSFGAGRPVELKLYSAEAGLLQRPGELTLYSGEGRWITGPHRDGDLLATLRALRRTGVTAIMLQPSTLIDEAFSEPGLYALDRIAGLETFFGGQLVSEGVAVGVPLPATALTRRNATLLNADVSAHEPPPCLTLDNGTGVWVELGDPQAARFYCPSRHPQLYR